MNMPSAWVAFLMTAEAELDRLEGPEGSIAAFHRGLDSKERIEIAQFLDEATSGNEAHCQAVTRLKDDLLNEIAFAPRPCLPFYRFARDTFSISGE